MSLPPRTTAYDAYPVPVLGGIHNGVFGIFPQSYVTLETTQGKAPAVIIGGREMPNHVSQTAIKVYRLIRANWYSNEGTHVRVIAEALGLPMEDAFRAAEELVEAGLTYSTTSRETWAAFDC